MQTYKHWPSSAHGLATRIGARHSEAERLLIDIQRYYPYQKDVALSCLNYVIETLDMEQWRLRLIQFVEEHPPALLRGAVMWRIVRDEEQFIADYDHA